MKRNNSKLLLALLSMILLLSMIPVTALAAESCAHSPKFGEAGVDATCTTDGKTGHVICRLCNTDLQPVTIIPALGHDFVDGTCSRCGEKASSAEPTPPVVTPPEVTPPEVTPPEVTPPAVTLPPSPFEDVSANDYFFAPVLWAAEENITKGYSDTLFAPDNACTRAQIVTFLWRAYGCPAPTITENPFRDLDESMYYYDAVLWAVEEGITTGVGLYGESFNPNGPCSRAQVVTFLWRSMGCPTPASSESSFTDVQESDYFAPAVQWAVEKGITTGLGDGTFGHDRACTRAHVVTFLYRNLVR